MTLSRRWMEKVPVINKLIEFRKATNGLKGEVKLLQEQNKQLAQLIEKEQQHNRELNEVLQNYEAALQMLQNQRIADKEELKVSIQKVRVETKKNLGDTRYEIGRQMQYNLIKSLSPEQYREALCEWYYSYMGERLDLDNPQSFNQKIQWMKLYDNTPLKTKLADKYEVREWVKETIGEEYLIPLLGVWDNFDEIDFDKLPDRFVLKANHGSGWNIIVKDKQEFDKEAAKKKFHVWIGRNYTYEGFELHYKGIKPKIIAEQYIENNDDLYDYKFICLDEKPRYVWLDTQRYTDHRRTIFGLEWRKQPFRIAYQPSDVEIPKPENFEKMKELVGMLCKGFPLVRVDLYNINGKIYFGEMTFSSENGKGKFEPKEYDLLWGSMVTLPEKKAFEGKML